MKITECKNQEQLLRSLKFKQDYVDNNSTLITKEDFFSKILLVQINKIDVGYISLHINDGEAHIKEFITTSKKIVSDILNLLDEYCYANFIECISVETTVEQSKIFKDLNYTLLDSMYIKNDCIVTKLNKTLKKERSSF